MKYFILLALVVLRSASATEDMASEAAIKQLLIATNTKKNFEELIIKSGKDNTNELKDILINEVAKELKGKSINPIQGNIVKNKVKEIFKMSNPSHMWDLLVPSFIKIYQDNLTDAEVNAILTFYKTPAGVALLVKMPRITSGSLGIAERMNENLAIKVRKIIDDGLSELRSQDLK